MIKFYQFPFAGSGNEIFLSAESYTDAAYDFRRPMLFEQHFFEHEGDMYPCDIDTNDRHVLQITSFMIQENHDSLWWVRKEKLHTMLLLVHVCINLSQYESVTISNKLETYVHMTLTQ